MAPGSRLKSLPPNFQTGLDLLERGYALSRDNGSPAPGPALPGAAAPPALAVLVLDLFRRLEDEKIDWVLVGGEAVNLYRKQPRATVDVDLVVRQKHIRKAKKVLAEMCGAVKESEVHLKAVLSPQPRELTVDVIKSQAHELFEATLDRRTLVEGIWAPPIEALLALKYLSAVSPWRPLGDKHQDASDFIKAYKDCRAHVNRGLLIELASRAHQNARVEFPVFLDAVEKDGPITL